MKTKKVWYQLIFIAAIVTSGFGSLEVWAAERSGYTGCSSSILKMVTVRNQFRDLLRNIEFNILSFLADVIDFFDKAISALILHKLWIHTYRRVTWKSIYLVKNNSAVLHKEEIYS